MVVYFEHNSRCLLFWLCLVFILIAKDEIHVWGIKIRKIINGAIQNSRSERLCANFCPDTGTIIIVLPFHTHHHHPPPPYIQ